MMLHENVVIPHHLGSVIEALEDSKAQNVNILNLVGKSDITDQMVFASGSSTTHLSSIAGHLIKKLKEIGINAISVDNQKNADWILVDTGEVIIHIFHPEKREFYQLEKMWAM